ncbi:MAG: hypothetical protein QOE22_355 [Candidatus Parcubacteria bacterium]|jgi:hypothetical protein|nr:hypothetical protein [Candidatus Parcubacteria bacterium]
MMSRIFPIVALVIAVGLFFGYINPTRAGSIAEKKAQIDSYESALQAAEHFKEREGQLIVAQSNIPSDGLARLASFLPDGVDNVQIILDLNTLAARSGVTLSDFDTGQGNVGTTPQQNAGTPGDPTASLTSDGPIDSLEITVSATGTYAAFRTLLDGIESSLRLLDVVSVSVQDSPTGVYKYDMTIRLYWLR